MPLNDRRYNSSFEYMFILSKGAPKTFNPIKVPCIHAGKRNTGTKYNPDGTLVSKHGVGRACKKEKVKNNIFTYSVGTEKQKIKHPARFPEKLVHDHIISWSNKGDIVFDPLMGSGTTGRVAKRLERGFIGIEIDEDYYNIAVETI